MRKSKPYKIERIIKSTPYNYIVYYLDKEEDKIKTIHLNTISRMNAKDARLTAEEIINEEIGGRLWKWKLTKKQTNW